MGPDAESSNLFLLAGEGGHSFAGNTPIANIRKDSPNILPILTLVLGRTVEQPPNAMQGTITVGEVLLDMVAVNDQPKLNLVPDAVLKNGSAVFAHWATRLDKDGFQINGKTVALPRSIVNGTTTPEQFLVVFDSGFTTSPVPKYASRLHGITEY
jgi:hypothetical protein